MEDFEPISFILEKPLFKKYDISNLDIEKFLDIILYDGFISCFCPYCRENSVFQSLNSINKQQLRINLNPGGNMYPGKTNKDFLDQFIKPGIYQLDFACARRQSHILTVFYKVENKTISKVGQSPSLFEIQKGDFKKYEKILGKSYQDLHNALMFYSFKFGVGAFTHLRRIIENFFIKEAYEIKRKESDWDEVRYKNLRFTEKLVLLRDNLPKNLLDNPNIYSIVSKGIHELEEDECILYFNAVKECIFLCLDDKLAEQERIQREKAVKDELTKINSKINFKNKPSI